MSPFFDNFDENGLSWLKNVLIRFILFSSPVDPDAFRPIQPVILDQNYIALKNQIIKAERRVLKELGFCVHVKHPHKVRHPENLRPLQLYVSDQAERILYQLISSIALAS